MKKRMRKEIGTLLGLGLLTTGSAAQETVEERLDQLEAENRDLTHKVDVLSDELERVDLGDVFTPIGESFGGLGPAASKIYGRESGLSVGGYGEMLYENRAGDGDELDFLRAVLYFGYKFSPKWVFNSEIEFEHASTGEEGSVSVEFAYLDYLAHETFNVRAGLVLIPMGFLNELHEPPTFLPATRPVTESRIIPSTWRENGVGAYGDVGPVSYRAYVVNGFDAEGFSDSGLRGGRQKGSEALADDLAAVARVDYTDIPGFLVGGSVYYGDSGQSNEGFGDTGTMIYEAHAEMRSHGVWLRGLVAMADVDDVAELNAAQGFTGDESVGEELEGYYVEGGYDVASLFDPEGAWSLSPYLRWETLDTQAEVPTGFASNSANDEEILTVGLNWQPIDQIVVKVEHQDWEDADDRVNVSLGYVF